MTRESWGVEIDERRWYERRVTIHLPDDSWDSVIVSEEVAEMYVRWDSHYQEFWDWRFSND